MNSGTQTIGATNTMTPVALGVAAATASKERTQELQEQIQRIASEKIRALLDREADLHAEIEKLSSMEGEKNRLNAAVAELQTVRVEMAKRGEDLANLSYAMAAEMETFGLLGGSALEDKDEDIAMRQAAHDAVIAAQDALTRANVNLENANTDLAQAKGLSEFFSYFNDRDKKIATANAAIKAAEASLIVKKTEVETAKQNVPVVEEQIDTNKRERLREASLVETYERISQWVTRAKEVLKKDITEYQEVLATTKASLSTAIENRVKASERIRAAEGKIAELESSLQAKETDRQDITDRMDPTYQRLTTEIAQLAADLDEQNNERKLAEGSFSDAEIGVKERQKSIEALTAHVQLAKHHFNRFLDSEETANVIGNALEVLVKGANREVINESLDKGIGKMTIAVYHVSQLAQISSTRQLNEMAQRKIALRAEMDQIDSEGAPVLAEQAAIYNGVTEALRRGYSEKGLDVEDMSNLRAAAELAQKIAGVPPQQPKDERY